MQATTVVLSSCGSAFDTVLTIFNNNGEFMHNSSFSLSNAA